MNETLEKQAGSGTIGDRESRRCGAEQFDVVIVGGGFSGVMVAVNTVQRARRPIRVAIIERKDDVGRGIAYAGTPRDALLNVAAGAMGAFPDQPDDFINWLRSSSPRSGPQADPAAYYPRELYGTYVTSLLRDAETAGHDITCIAANVVDVERIGTEIAVVARDGRRIAVGSQVVLALGASPPADVVTGSAALRDHPRYIADPWVFLKRSDFAAHGTIVIVGSGLTALDTIAAYARTGYHNGLVVVSRNGRFPKPHGSGGAPPLDPIEPGDAPRTLRDIVRMVRRALRAAAARGDDWRPVIDGLRPHIAKLWMGLDTADRLRYVRHVRALYDPYRHRTPAAVLAVKDELAAAGRLSSIAGRIGALRARPDAIDVHLMPRGAVHETIVRAAQVINCAGPANAYAADADSLPGRLLAAGVVSRHSTGIGLAADPDGRLIDAAGIAQPNLFTIGWPMRGVLLETTAVRELRAQARVLADTLLASLPSQSAVL